MQSAVWNRAKEIFDELADEPAGRRTALLDGACGGDAELKASVQRLLDAHERAGDFLREPTLHAATIIEAVQRSRSIGETRAGGGTPDGDSRLLPISGERRIGRYKLLEIIGEGGFGTVYMAEQVEPVRRRVALKIIKPGMDSRQIVARFEAERQALALMDHPNIAKVLDGGETESGRPYFVMELVRGVPITEFCDQQRLTPPERLDLFLPVCHAVQHAHQKGIIHRDIKPTNVLVTLHDGRPVPKVIDFGIAKAMHTPLTEKTLFTEFRQLIGTPTYMSPEQAEMSGLDVDTRSDIYSLGVLLYELLTGTTPLDGRKLIEAGYAELQRSIKEVEPPRPSTRVSSVARKTRPRTADARKQRPASSGLDGSAEAGAEVTAQTIAHYRRTDTQSLCRLLRGDLDWIVMKCLEKDRSRRFGSAGDLAADVDRYRRDEPVLARPPSTLYRLSKLARRNRAAFIAAGAIVLAIGAGFALSVAGFVAALRAQDDARAQQLIAERHAEEAGRAAAQAEAVNGFLQQMLASADPVYGGRREISVREALDRAVARLDAGALRDQPQVEAAVRLTIGRTYGSVAQYDAGLRQLDRAVELYRATGGEKSLGYADAVHQRGAILKFKGDAAGADAAMRTALAVYREQLPASSLRLAASLNDIATLIVDPARADEAEGLLREALAIARLPQHAGDAVLGDVLNNLAHAPQRRRDWASAEALYREAIEVNRARLGATHPHIATNLDNLAQVLVGKGELDAAERSYRESLAMRRELFGSDHPDVGTSLHNLATLLWMRGQREECETVLKESLDIFRRVHGLANMDTLTVVDSLVSVVGSRSELSTAESLLLESYEAIRDEGKIPVDRKRRTAQRLVDLYTAMKKPEKVEEWEGERDRVSPSP